jgi:hypothetical protein
MVGSSCTCNPPSFYSGFLDECVYCDINCDNCNYLGNCDSCKHGYFLTEAGCGKCEENCIECLSAENCSKCSKSSVLHAEIGSCKHYCHSGFLKSSAASCDYIPDYIMFYKFDSEKHLPGLIYDSP